MNICRKIIKHIPLALRDRALQPDELLKRNDHQILDEWTVSGTSSLQFLCISIVGFFAFSILFTGIYILSAGHQRELSFTFRGGYWTQLSVYLLLFIVPIPLHELIHGVFMSLHGGKPRYGVGVRYILPYAYATAERVFTRDQFFQIALAPLIVTENFL